MIPTESDSDERTDPVSRLDGLLTSIEPGLTDTEIERFETALDQLREVDDGRTVRVSPETHEHLDHVTSADETHDDAIRRLLSAVPGPNEWTCWQCGDSVCSPDAHHETNDLVLWQLQVDDSDHYRPGAFCSQRCFREHIDGLVGDVEAER
ncbi:hypothetical protein [Haloglomus litoreum]|uniref:hypothetical protein n=1 Tax=Haloglomus litoreum TaxID=3034026 RepID=UPI0023E78057|nr:hypothetical protein [Haloglomus sp. DT116]